MKTRPTRQDEASTQLITVKVLRRAQIHHACKVLRTNISDVCRTALEEMCEEAAERVPHIGAPATLDRDQLFFRVTVEEASRYRDAARILDVRMADVCRRALTELLSEAAEFELLDRTF